MSTETKDARKGLSGVTVFFIILFVIVAGLYGIVRYSAAEKMRENAAFYAETTASIQDAKNRQIEDAMLGGRAVSGMTKYQVLKSMGSPEKVEKTSDEQNAERRAALQNLHVFETLHYYSKDSMVLVDSSGTVVFVSEYNK